MNGTPTLSPSPMLAVVGCGQWGLNLVREFSKLGVLAAVVDEIPARAEAAAKLHGNDTMVFRSWQEVLDDTSIMAVALATPARTHTDMAIAVLASGKHVFVEKPMAMSLADGQRLAAAARASPRKLMVGHVFRYHPAFSKLVELVHRGELGRLHYVYSTRMAPGRIRQDENAWWSLAPHDISMILALLGDQNDVSVLPESVTADASFLLGRSHIADAATVKFRFPGSIHAQIAVSWLHPEKERKLVVVGDKAMAVFDDTKPWPQKLVVFQHSTVWTDGVPELAQGNSEAVVIDTEAESLSAECAHFLDCIRHDKEPVTGIDEALAVVRLLAAGARAMAGQGEGENDGDILGVTTTKDNEDGGTLPTSSRNIKVHATAVIDPGCEIEDGTSIWCFSHLLAGAKVGQGCNIGQNVFIGQGVVMGDRCKIQNNVSVYSGVRLEDGVFCGPSCVFTNVMTPRAEVERKTEFLSTIVRRGATVGANATVVCGVELGQFCMVGAGAVVTRSVRPHSLVFGNPARHSGWVSASGERLGADLVCPRTGEKYALDEQGDLISVSSNQLVVPSILHALPNQPEFSKASISFIDLKTQNKRIRGRLDARIAQVLDAANFIRGQEVLELEKTLSEYTGAAHVIGCANGTDALSLALMAMNLRPGDAVLVPTFTFVASVEPIVLLGGIPIFVDVEPTNFTLDLLLISAGVEAARHAGHRPVGIIAVDIFGYPANYDDLSAAATSHGLWIIADAAQSFGASVNGRKVGTLAKITTTSFFPSKPLGCYGDGGAIFTDDEHIASTLRSLQHHGRGSSKYDSVRVGMNSRLDTLQAAVLLAKLEVFDDEIRTKQDVAARYAEYLRLSCPSIIHPTNLDGTTSAWASYTVRMGGTTTRQVIRKHLEEQGIPTMVYYPKPVHMMEAYREFPVATGNCTVAERAAAEVLSLPMHPYLEDETQRRIVRLIKERL